MLTWNANLLLGVKPVDDEHHHLFNLFDEIITLSNIVPFQKDLIQSKCNNVRSYIHQHFKNEEQFMVEMGYDKSDFHCSIHRIMEQTLDEKIDALCRHTDNNSAAEFANFVGSWLKLHILEEDSRYVLFYRKKNATLFDKIRNFFFGLY